MCIFIYNLYIHLSRMEYRQYVEQNGTKKINKDINAGAATPESQNEEHGWGQDWNVQA